MVNLINLGLLYIAFVIVIVLHELGHRPEKIRFNKLFGVFPISASAISCEYRLGGLIVNVALFLTIALLKPESLIIQYIGLVSWIHFVLYAFFGSIIPEPKSGNVNFKTYVFDDVPNNQWFIFIPLSIVTFILFKSYYLGVLTTVIGGI